MRIAIATDFSPAAVQAANTAAALALRTHEPLLLAHVGAPLPRQTSPSPSGNAEPVTENPALHLEAQRLRTRGCHVQETLLHGPPAATLSSWTRDWEAQLLVLGSPPLPPCSHAFIGDVLKNTASTCPTPILVVRSAAIETVLSLPNPRLKVVVGIDFTQSSDAALRWTRQLRDLVPCDVVGVYVSWPAKAAEHFGIPTPPGASQLPDAARCLLETELRDRLHLGLGTDSARVRIELGPSPYHRSLIDAARNEQAHLLVVGNHQRHGLDRLRQGSVSCGVIRDAPLNVVCVPLPEPSAANLTPPRRVSRILAAIDFSEPSPFLVAHACSLLNPGGQLTLLHVLHPRALPDGEYSQGLAPDPRHSAVVQECQQRLANLLPPGLPSQGVAVTSEVVEAEEPSKAICQAARRHRSELVCLGLRQPPQPSKLTIGQILQPVIKQCTVPVLVVVPPKP